MCYNPGYYTTKDMGEEKGNHVIRQSIGGRRQTADLSARPINETQQLMKEPFDQNIVGALVKHNILDLPKTVVEHYFKIGYNFERKNLKKLVKDCLRESLQIVGVYKNSKTQEEDPMAILHGSYFVKMSNDGNKLAFVRETDTTANYSLPFIINYLQQTDLGSGYLRESESVTEDYIGTSTFSMRLKLLGKSNGLNGDTTIGTKFKLNSVNFTIYDFMYETTTGPIYVIKTNISDTDGANIRNHSLILTDLEKLAELESLDFSIPYSLRLMHGILSKALKVK